MFTNSSVISTFDPSRNPEIISPRLSFKATLNFGFPDCGLGKNKLFPCSSRFSIFSKDAKGILDIVTSVSRP